MAEPEANDCRKSMCSRENRTWVREPAILRTVLGSCVGSHVSGSAAGHGRALPSHAAALPGKAAGN
jgi:hypothetical protein